MIPARLRIAVLAALLGLTGCALFQPTEPEPPSGGVVQTDYSSPEATLATLELAVEDKGAANGQTAYLGGLATTAEVGVDFDATFLAASVQALPGITVPTRWSSSDEATFYQRLIEIDDDAYRMTFSEDVRFSGGDVTNPDDATRSTIYLVESGSGVIARGYALMHFVRSPNGRWLITLWEERDLEAGDDPLKTFTALRLKP